jgi:serine/threonine protein kinase
MVTALADRYELGDALGKGRSTVYRAVDTRLRRTVAIKRVALWPGAEGEDAVRKRAIREAQAAARLNNASVVAVYDVIEEPGAVWLVMELVEGPSLATLVADEGPLPHRRAAAIGLGVLTALEAAHLVGVVHRDVKPANVLVPASGGPPKLTDFGVATIRDESRVTATGLIVGSPSYMAPEQATGGTVSPSTDLWSFGALLYFAVEGEPPFLAGNALATAAAVVHREPRAVQRPGPLTPVIRDLLVKNPDSRATAGQVRVALARIARGDAAPLRRQGAPPPVAPAPVAPPPVAPAPVAPPVVSPVADTTAVLPSEPAVAPMPALQSAAPEPAVAPTPAPEPAVPEPAVEPTAAPEPAVPEPVESVHPHSVEPEPLASASPAAPGPVQPEPTEGVRVPAVEPEPALPPDPEPIDPAEPAPAPDAPDPVSVVSSGRSGPSAPGTDPRPSARSSADTRARWRIVGVAAAVLVAVAVGVPALARDGDAGGWFGDTGERATPPGSGAQNDTDEPTGDEGADATTTTAATSSTTAPPITTAPPAVAGIPAGWTPYTDPAGAYTIGVPPGWQVQQLASNRIDLVDPSSGVFLRVEYTATPGSDPAQAWRELEPAVATGNTNYQQVGIAPAAYRDYVAALWEFRYGTGDQTLHTGNLGFLANGRGYALMLRTPEALWAASQPLFEQLKRSFQPT